MPKVPSKANTVQNKIEIEMTGGPLSPAQHRIWMKDGANALKDHIFGELQALSYEGRFTLNGVRAKKGSQHTMIRIGSVVPERNAIGIVAQLGSKESKWCYELMAPPYVDIVELHQQLIDRQDTSGQDDEDDVVEDELPLVESNVVELRHSESVVDNVAFDDDTDKSTSAEDGLLSSQFASVFLELEVLSAEYQSARKMISENQPEIDKLRQQIADAQQLLSMYEEECRKASAILQSKAHQQADEKIQQIRSIIES